MALKRVLDSLDGLAPELAALYAEKDGKFHLQVEGDDGGDLRAALEKERKANRDLANKIKKWEQLGKTDEEIAELIAEHEERATKDAERKGEWDKLRQQMVEKHEKALAAKDAEIAAMQTAVEEYLIDAQLTAEIAKERGMPELLLPHARKRMKVIKGEDGKYSAIVVGLDGNPAVDEKGNPLAIGEIIREFKQSPIYGRCFEASGQTGSGKQPGNGVGRGGQGFPTREDADMGGDRGQRLAAIKQKFGPRIAQLKAEAGE